MPRSPRRASSVSGLFKECKHKDWVCPCPWLGRYLHVRRVNLQKWSGIPKGDFNKTKAKEVLKELQAQVLARTFNERSRDSALGGEAISFGHALDTHQAAKERKGKTYATYYAGWKQQFGSWDLVQLSVSGATDIEDWLKKNKAEKKWSDVNTHRWCEYGSRFFNWAIKKKKWIRENPCDLVDDSVIGNGKARKRKTRISPEHEAALLRVGPQLPDWEWMRRWMIGALDVGVRRTELLNVKVKDVDFQNWIIRLPETKSQEPQCVHAQTERLQKILEQRRFLGDEAYVFGDDSGKRVSVDRFQRRWKRWFKAAGIPIGLKGGFVWHDFRHEFVSYLLDQGEKLHDVKDAARHADIATTMGYVATLEEKQKETFATMQRRSAG